MSDILDGIFAGHGVNERTSTGASRLPFRRMGEALRDTPDEPEMNVRGWSGRGWSR